MHRLSPSWRTIATYLGSDVPFVLLVAVVYANLIAVELGAVLGLAASIWLVLLAINTLILRRMMRPLDLWRQADPDDDRPLLDARDALASAPGRTALVQVLGYDLTYIVLTLYLWFARADDIPIGPAELGPIALLILGVSAGATLSAISIVTWLLRDERIELSRAIDLRGLDPTTRPASLTHRLGALVVVLILSPAGLFCAAARSSDVALERLTTITRLDALAGSEAARVEAGLEPERGRIVESEASPFATTDSAALDPAIETEHHVIVDRRTQTAAVALALDGSRWLVVEAAIETDLPRVIRLILIGLVFLLGAPIIAIVVPRTLVSPLLALQASMRRLTHVGDLREMEHVPVIEDDEVGALTRDMNALLDELTALADAAQAVSDGELHTRFDRSGDLHDAFVAMLDWLRQMVGRIRETATDVVSGAAEIQAATNEQEVAARKHSRDVAEVSEHIAVLAAAATDITDAANDVLVNAEQTAGMSDDMNTKISELVRQLDGITQLLEIIREVADRSDLLALNGSLEATRAGEAGRGFALVATEMRRLAERVTAAVVDVRARLEAIETASGATIQATAASRRLAQSTAESARRISAFTAEQGENTLRVAATMENMAEFVVSASTATSQTLAATVGLSRRIEELERLTQHFELESKGD